MAKHQMNLNPVAFKQIKDGKKIIESRLYDQKRRSIEISDIITFNSNEDMMNVVVTDLLIYECFEELFSSHDFNLFGGVSLIDLMTIYKYYSKEDEKEFGVVGIKFTPQ